MIKAQFGMFGAYDSLDKIEVKNTQNEAIIVSFKSTQLPPITLFVQTNASTAIISLVRYSDNATIAASLTNTVTDYGNYIRIKYAGETVGKKDEAYYYYKIVCGSETFYTDAFLLKDDVTGLFGVKVTCSDFSIGRKQEYEVDTTNTAYECYIRLFGYNGIEMQNEEDANEEDGEIKPYYTGISMYREFILEAREYIYKFLLSLRTLLVNGSLEVYYGGDTFYDVGDVTTELESASGDFDIVNIRFKFVANNDILTPINTI